MGVPGRNGVFPVQLSTPGVRRSQCARDGCAASQAVKGHGQEARTKGLRGGRAGEKRKRGDPQHALPIPTPTERRSASGRRNQ